MVNSRETRQEQELCRPEIRLCAKGREYTVAVEPRHVHIAQYEIGPRCARKVDTRHAGGSFDDFVARSTQDVREGCALFVVVVDQEQSSHGQAHDEYAPAGRVVKR
jgi:hypothetical protein